ncbi:MAG: hypothetical protein AAGG68_25120 [Bacteroidota bacterium]
MREWHEVQKSRATDEYIFGKTDEAYTVYLPDGGSTTFTNELESYVLNLRRLNRNR